MVQTTVVDRVYKEFHDLILYLSERGEASYRNIAEEQFRKALLLTSASYFELRIGEDIIALAKQTPDTNPLLAEFVKNKAVSRQFHTFFDWGKRNANLFFGLFGRTFGAFMQSEVNNNVELDRAIRAFLEIGDERNRMVHENFGAFTSEKTVEEIYELYKIAIKFVDAIPDCFRRCPREA